MSSEKSLNFNIDNGQPQLPDYSDRNNIALKD